ncbi:hypothetical protein J2S48_000542 [Promicromonospora iranensis]|uniref:Uncharacterized protein n=1 Tax=Promicromonospora iranensis TaxID=1105144 RepID=A0ABU2CI67_9MICO|nr:hypothetical protein [Promicromonospora iranensis]
MAFSSTYDLDAQAVSDAALGGLLHLGPGPGAASAR